jgi:PadR family transcriptional regulator, regulatory protein PadR
MPELPRTLIAASSRPLVLAILAERKESYGYEIIQEVKRLSGGVMEWQDGMLYPVLHRLEEEGLIVSRWGVAENGRQRKYYQLHQEGRNALKTEMTQWLQVHQTLMNVWKADPSLT